MDVFSNALEIYTYLFTLIRVHTVIITDLRSSALTRVSNRGKPSIRSEKLVSMDYNPGNSYHHRERVSSAATTTSRFSL